MDQSLRVDWGECVGKTEVKVDRDKDKFKLILVRGTVDRDSSIPLCRARQRCEDKISRAGPLRQICRDKPDPPESGEFVTNLFFLSRVANTHRNKLGSKRLSRTVACLLMMADQRLGKNSLQCLRAGVQVRLCHGYVGERRL